MKKFIQSKYFTYALAVAFGVAFIAFFIYNPSHAYFQVHKELTGVNTARVDLLFDKFTPNAEEGGVKGDFVYGNFQGNIYNDEWGTAKNPYVMTGKNHVNNLAILQKSGYFKNKTTTSTIINENGEEEPVQVPRQSHFVVAKKDGTPTVINCEGMNINPIGTPLDPFTGIIQGAPMEGTAEYEIGGTKYETTQSAIANLNIVANENTPDIGFFGKLGFVGDLTLTTTVTPDGVNSEGATVYKNVETGTLDGFAASVSNLLFADITIKTKQTVFDDVIKTIDNWWAATGTRTFTRITIAADKTETSEEVTENIDSSHGTCNETHHIGIVAGHAEWATLKDISVYFSEDVEAFDLPQADNSDTSFYSISGILGTIKYVNPTVDAETGIMSSENSVSDEDLELTGGGGTLSGSLTGYMLAKNIFDAYDSKVAADQKQEAYDTILMTDIFKKVTMPQGKRGNRTYRNYYYFCDSIFTFAMSASVAANASGEAIEDINDRSQKDYAIRIWPIDETATWNGTCPPPITIATPGTGSANAWEYVPDLSKQDVIHKLTRITKEEDLKPGSSYALAYIENEGLENEVIHLFHLASFDKGFTMVLPTFSGKVYLGDPTDPNVEKADRATERDTSNSNKIKALYVRSGNNTNYCPYTFSYNAEKKNSALRTFFDGTYTFAIHSESEGHAAGYIAGEFSEPTIYYKTAFANQSTYQMYWNEWDFTYLNDGTFKVTLEAKALADIDLPWGFGDVYASFYSKLVFDTSTDESGNKVNKFTIRSNYRSNYGSHPSVSEPVYSTDNQEGLLSEYDKQGFAVFKLDGYEISTDTPYNYLPTDDASTYQFNPSTDVLFYDKTTTDTLNNGNNYYTVEPLESKKWNNGNGELLTELNHAIKMSQPPQKTTEIVIGNLFTSQYDIINEILGALFDESSGGTIYVPVGTTGKGFAIPAGTIAFDIREASENEPSNINIVVAINAGNTQPSSIGLWYMEEKLWNTEFTLENPNQYFPLPISKEITAEADNQYVTHISSYITKTGEDTFSDPITGDHSTHLRGDTVLVGYSFKVTTPGIYLLASTNGPMNVCYFSVDGAAGYGDDGTGALPLGSIDFVYDNGIGDTVGDTIITVDKKYTEDIHEVSKETPATAYYPSYYYLRMYPNTLKPDTTSDYFGTIPYEKVYVRRYIVTEDTTLTTGDTVDRLRVIELSCLDPDTHLRGVSKFYQDIDASTLTPTS